MLLCKVLNLFFYGFVLKSDCIVVGAGIVGLAIAQRLVSQGLKVSVLHRSYDEGGMASYAAGAMLGAFGEVSIESATPYGELELAFRVEAARLYPDWIKELIEEEKEVLIRSGTFLVANAYGRNDSKNLAAIETALLNYKEPYEVVGKEDIAGYLPSRGMELQRAIFIPGENYVDATKLMALLKKRLTAHSACQFFDFLVTGLIYSDDGEVRGVEVEGGQRFEAENVILAAGVGSSALYENAPHHVKSPKLIPGKGVGIVLQTDMTFSHVIRSPNRHFACGVHLVPRSDKEVYIGATNRTASCPGTSPGASVEEVHDILHEAVHEINTNLESANILQLSAGSRPLAVDSRPVIGKTNVKGLYLATGTYRNGVLMAPLIADLIASEIRGAPIEKWAPFSPGYAERRPSAEDFKKLIHAGAEGIASFLPQPHGKLPYNRENELRDFLEVLFALALVDKASPGFTEEDLSQLENLRREAKELVSDRPMIETFAQLFYKFHQFKQLENLKKR